MQYPTSQDEDFSDLVAFANSVADADIVFLGENHGDGTSNSLRGRITKFLHRSYGFNTVAWEMGPFDGYRAYSQMLQLSQDQITVASIGSIAQQNVANSFWAFNNETQPIFQYIASVAKSPNPLELVGYDYGGMGNNGFFWYTPKNLWPKLYQFLLNALPLELQPTQSYYDILQNVSQFTYLFGSASSYPSEESQTDFFNTLNITTSYLYHISGSPGTNATFDMFVQIYNQSGALARDSWGYVNINTRDAQMASNLEWFLSKNLGSQVGITKRKMVVWTGQGHGMLNTNAMADPSYQMPSDCESNPCSAIYCGQHLREAGIKTVSITTLSLGGQTGSLEAKFPCNFNPLLDITTPYQSLEYAFKEAGFTVAAYLDMRDKSSLPSWLTDDMTFNNNQPNQGPTLVAQLPSMYDGALFYNTMAGYNCMADFITTTN